MPYLCFFNAIMRVLEEIQKIGVFKIRVYKIIKGIFDLILCSQLWLFYNNVEYVILWVYFNTCIANPEVHEKNLFHSTTSYGLK
ncbi:MAG: hypothetical protein NVS9B9_20640 [Ktedonobacteraceae bacterium]